ncbi:hypothetical protein EV401DRAFT_28097 [Pisolithus croceorrhizus]|nr:hypothetical protein EV401DRAFT_28097 [Pisolithus croceorrhizus]
MLLRCLYEISLSFPRFLTFSPCIILLCICVITHADPCSFACRSECSHHQVSNCCLAVIPLQPCRQLLSVNDV